jgi:uncharacterized protein (TIGR02145 family)
MLSKKALFLFVAAAFALFACKKTQKDVPVGECGVVNYDGFDYHTVKIGNQCWLKENLRNTHFNDGTTITEAEDSLTWVSDSTGAWCIYGGDSISMQARIDTEAYFGKLYSWKAATDPRMCPNGWHMPTISEWKQLTDNYIESGCALKKVDGHWANGGPYAAPTDISNFSALPAGGRTYNATFHLIDSSAYFWSNDPLNVLPVVIHYNTKFADVNPSIVGPARGGFSCRCIQNQ